MSRNDLPGYTVPHPSLPFPAQVYLSCSSLFHLFRSHLSIHHLPPPLYHRHVLFCWSHCFLVVLIIFYLYLLPPSILLFPAFLASPITRKPLYPHPSVHSHFPSFVSSAFPFHSYLVRPSITSPLYIPTIPFLSVYSM